MVTTAACLFLFFLLQLWRPCYFLTDDNLSCGLPIFTEMGRNLRAGHLPFTSQYLFGGNYNFLRDMDTMAWHPFTLLPALLADTAARFWILDIEAFCLLVMGTAGFTLLACRLRDEMAIAIPDGYIVFYTLSFIFSTFMLTIGSAWMNFLANQSALPWLAYAILDRKIARGTFLVALVTIHEMLIGFLPLNVTTGLVMTLFTLGVVRWRRSGAAFFTWYAGNVLAISVLLPLLLLVMNGFSHSERMIGVPLTQLTAHAIPTATFVFSFFLGNWSELLATWAGDHTLESLTFPYVTSVMASAASLCVIPTLFNRARWQPLDKVCLLLAGLLLVWIVRPQWLAEVMSHLPFFRSMRWAFREGLLFLFFAHLLLILRFPAQGRRTLACVSVASLLLFLLPLPFIRVPTLNPLELDRQLLFTGKAERFWAGVKTQLKPADSVATVLDIAYFRANAGDIPYTLLDTADFPAFFQVRSISGYSPTAPSDQISVKTVPEWWFGGFTERQAAQLMAERPDVKILRVKTTHPLRIIMSSGDGPEVDLTPYIEAAGITSAPAPTAVP